MFSGANARALLNGAAKQFLCNGTKRVRVHASPEYSVSCAAGM
jgi:hypothetical protein